MASATDATLQNHMMPTHPGSMPWNKLLPARLYPMCRAAKFALYPKTQRPSGRGHSYDFLIADRHFHHNLPGAFVVSG
jgi:hypothetical protein